MDENQTIDLDRVQKINIEEEMKKSYIDYSMSVIVARALLMFAMDLSRYTAASSTVCSVSATQAATLIRSVRASLVRCSVSITHTATCLSMALWCVWDRVGTCATCLWTDRVTLVR